MNFGAIDHDGSTPDVQIDQYACPDGAHGGFGKPVGITEVSGEISRRLGNYSPVCGVAFATALMQHRQYPQSRDPIVRRGQLKLKAGVTKMRVLGDGYYSLAYRDDLARWNIAGPRVLSAGTHVNGPTMDTSAEVLAHT